MSIVMEDQTEARLIEAAAKFGCKLVIPYVYELVIDLDKGMKLNKRTMEVLLEEEYLGPFVPLRTRSKSGFEHVYLMLANIDPQFTPSQRIALQAALGSDPVKEALSILTINSETPIALFETPVEHSRVMAWRLTCAAKAQRQGMRYEN